MAVVLNLAWGYLQEYTMTTHFIPTARTPDGRFPSAAFCVFTNRLCALVLSFLLVTCRHGCKRNFPLRAFSPIALSNSLSSCCQYASLRYVSFQVLQVARSSKSVPVMLLGTLIHGRMYAGIEYVEGAALAFAVSWFAVTTKDSRYSAETEVHGILFICAYLLFDALSLQWQEKLYQTYGRRNIDPFQMMMGVNLFAVLFITTSLVLSGELTIVIEFLKVNQQVEFKLFVMARGFSIGQISIVFLIREFGPIVFTIVMTIRQMLSIELLALIFGNQLSFVPSMALVVVFTVVVLQIRRNYSLARDPELITT